jgi:hypothetical protein
LGCIGLVYQDDSNFGPDTVTDIWSGAITSFSVCAEVEGELNPENDWIYGPWCAGVGYNPVALQRTDELCDVE